MRQLETDTPRAIGLETEYGLYPVPTTTRLSAATLGAALDPGITSIESTGFLSNGARFYMDVNNNAEYATPECTTIDGLLAAHFAGESIVAATIRRLRPDLKVAKRSTDSGMQSRGDHENYTVGGGLNIAHAANLLVSYLCSRTVLTGPGMFKLSDTKRKWGYAIDQKIFDLGVIWGSESTKKSKKPYVMDRNRAKDDNFDETGATQRLQVHSGSANMFPWPIVCRFFGTSLLLRLIENNVDLTDLQLVDPVVAGRTIAQDPNLRTKVTLDRGGKPVRYNGVELQLAFLERALSFAKDHPELPRDEVETAELSYQIVSDFHKKDFEPWAQHVEWVKKLSVVNSWHQRHSGIPFDYDARSAEIDIRWHDLDGIVAIEERRKVLPYMPSAERIEQTKLTPFDNTRARIRAEFIKRNGSRIGDINWGWGKLSNYAEPLVWRPAHVGLDLDSID